MIEQLDSPLKRIVNFSGKVSILTFVITALLVFGLIVIATALHIELYLFLAVISLPILWTTIFYPRTWIYFIALGFTVFFQTQDTKVNAFHILVGFFYNTFLMVWFINKLFIKRQQITKNIMDKFLLFFFAALLCCNFVIAFLNGIQPFDWFREFLLHSLILYYFPIREYFYEEKHFCRLLFLVGISTAVISGIQFYGYYKILKDITYAFQMGGSIRKNQELYAAVGFCGIAFFFCLRTFKAKLYSIVISGLAIGALITTLSRAYWVSLMGMIAILIPYLKIKQTLQLFIAFIILFSGSMLFLQEFMPDKADLFQKYIGKRLMSTSQGKQDISIRSRLYEYEKAIQHIKESPILGQGHRYEFSFFNPISQETSKTSFIHNGYINLALKTGIPLTVIFYLALLLYLIKGFLISVRTKSKFYQTLAICGYLSLFMLFATNFVTSSFFFRDGTMVTALSIAMISAAEKYNTQEKLMLQAV